MYRPYNLLISLILLMFATGATGQSGDESELQSIADATAGADRYEGFVDFYYRPSSGELFLEIDRFDEEFLYVDSLATGLGSNDIGLDRGSPGGQRVVKFERLGNQVFLKHINLRYRAQSENPLERLAVEEAFAESVIWGFTIIAATGDSVLVNATEFFLNDIHGVIDDLARTNQGNYSVDNSRSAIYMPRTKNFPLNTEFEAQLTFGSAGRGGNLVRTVTPSGDSITVRLHHSFVQLPDDDYTPRVFHAQSGYFARSFVDYAAPINQVDKSGCTASVLLSRVCYPRQASFSTVQPDLST